MSFFPNFDWLFVLTAFSLLQTNAWKSNRREVGFVQLRMWWILLITAENSNQNSSLRKQVTLNPQTEGRERRTLAISKHPYIQSAGLSHVIVPPTFWAGLLFHLNISENTLRDTLHNVFLYCLSYFYITVTKQHNQDVAGSFFVPPGLSVLQYLIK